MHVLILGGTGFVGRYVAAALMREGYETSVVSRSAGKGGNGPRRVVWNGWDNDKNIPDLGAGNHVGYLCVERGDVADYAATLAPGGSYRVSMTLGEE